MAEQNPPSDSVALLFPPTGSQYDTISEFKGVFQGLFWDKGLHFHGLIGEMGDPVGNTDSFTYACKQCLFVVARVVAVKPKGIEKRYILTQSRPCYLPCLKIRQEKPMDDPLNLMRLPRDRDQFSDVGKICSRVAIYATLNNKPMWVKSRQRLVWNCPRRGCKGSLAAFPYADFFVICLSIECECKLGIPNDIFISSNGGSGSADGDSRGSNDSYDSDNDKKPPAKPRAADNSASNRRGASGAGFRQVGSNGEGPFESDEGPVMGHATGYARMRSSNDDDSSKEAVESTVKKVGSRNWPGESNLKRERPPSNGSGSEDVDKVETPGLICPICQKPIARPLVTLKCTCRAALHRTCLDEFIHLRPPSMPEFVMSVINRRPCNGIVRMGPEERHICPNCRAPFDLYQDDSGRTRNVEFPVGYHRDKAIMDEAEFERRLLRHKKRWGKEKGITTEDYAKMVELQVQNAELFGFPDEEVGISVYSGPDGDTDGSEEDASVEDVEVIEILEEEVEAEMAGEAAAEPEAEVAAGQGIHGRDRGSERRDGSGGGKSKSR